MVLKLNNEKISIKNKSLTDVYNECPGIVDQSEKFKQLETVTLGEVNSLYVGQGEYAVISGHRELPFTVGSDDATTCHIGIFRRVKTNTCSVFHLDNRAGQNESLVDIVQQMNELDGNLGDIDVYAIGGYSSQSYDEDCIDHKNCSEEISLKLLHFMASSLITFNIKLLCTCKLNTKYSKAKPALTGLAIDRRTNEVFPANFSVRCPATILRSAFFWVVGSDNLVNIYDPHLEAVVVRPFHDWEQDKFALLSKLSDTVLLSYFSTSPLVEPPTFCSRLKETFSLLGSTNSIFEKDRIKYFKLNEAGHWVEHCQKNSQA